jgi:hypothetical protein
VKHYHQVGSITEALRGVDGVDRLVADTDATLDATVANWRFTVRRLGVAARVDDAGRIARDAVSGGGRWPAGLRAAMAAVS